MLSVTVEWLQGEDCEAGKLRWGRCRHYRRGWLQCQAEQEVRAGAAGLLREQGLRHSRGQVQGAKGRHCHEGGQDGYVRCHRSGTG